MAPFDVDPDWYTREWEAPPPASGARPKPILRTAWLLTAGLAAWFVAGSCVAGWLATVCGWLEPALR